ncbi:MAG: divergent polysaccharide deacetylase family protein [Actinobacteria bacterium]|nr:divergent polysaccharide deacetylase family protein [Actinomycetota bacterium]
MEENEFHVDMREVYARRRRMRRRKRLKRTLVLGTCLAALMAALIVFSPWGPGKNLFFGRESMGAERAGETRPAGGRSSGDIAPLPGDEDGGEPQGGDAEALPARKEKTSDPSPPTVAIVVDDTGGDVANLERWLAVDAPVTFAVMPHYQASAQAAERLYAAGYRIMMHIPTENDPPNSFSGTGQLSVGMGRDSVFATLDGDLATVPHATGINNHQGGRGCNDYQLMRYMCEWAKECGFFVVDSNSSARSQVTRASQDLGFPRRSNQVFIDHHNEPDTIREAMRRLARIARQEGTAIGICHFQRPNTPAVVGEMIRALRAEGIHFAFVQDISN